MAGTSSREAFFRKLVRTGAVVALILMICVTFVIFFFDAWGYTALETGFRATDGSVDLRGYNLESGRPVKLRGEWTLMEGFYYGNDGDKLSRDRRGVALPVMDIDEAVYGGTYRLLVRTGARELPYMALYIPCNAEDFQVYLDGVHVSANNASALGGGFVFSKFLYYINFDASMADHEILVVTGKDPGESLFFRETVLLGSRIRITEHVVWVWGSSFFITGLLVAMVINSLVFMVLRPEHKMITRVTIFDNLLTLRVLLATTELFYLFYTITGADAVSARTMLNAQYVVLALAGIAGCFLSEHLFNSGKMSRFTKAVCLAFLVCILMFLVPIPGLNAFVKGIPMFAAYAGSMAITGWHAVKTLRRAPSTYNIVQVVKTIYIGSVVCFDLLVLNGLSFNFRYLIYLYIAFLLAHVVMRLLDNNNSYRMAEALNQNLERLVQERTAQLTLANRRLSEISIRDALTGAYNRLYFEHYMEELLAKDATHRGLLHMAIFDLDHFKTINDTYGHDAGDEVLIRMVQIVKENLAHGMTLARVGGEEFAIVMQGIPSVQALAGIERIREAVADEKRKIWTSASFGISQYRSGQNAKSLFREADQCLYAAKNAGRNCVRADFYAAMPDERTEKR